MEDQGVGNATETLDKIREGGTILVSIALTRLEEAAEALRNGRFDMAFGRVGEAEEKIGNLARAQSHLGGYTGEETIIVRARQLQPGMRLPHAGVIESLEEFEEECIGRPPHQMFRVKVSGEDEPIELNGEREIMAFMEATG